MAESLICLDTNYLILGLCRGSKEEADLVRWHGEGVFLVTSTICWYEFLCGPVTSEQVDVMQSIVKAVLPFGEREAVIASEFFQKANRKRALQVDAMIAATAWVAGASLATRNGEDFIHFKALKLTAG